MDKIKLPGKYVNGHEKLAEYADKTLEYIENKATNDEIRQILVQLRTGGEFTRNSKDDLLIVLLNRLQALKLIELEKVLEEKLIKDLDGQPVLPAGACPKVRKIQVGIDGEIRKRITNFGHGQNLSVTAIGYKRHEEIYFIKFKIERSGECFNARVISSLGSDGQATYEVLNMIPSVEGIQYYVNAG